MLFGCPVDRFLMDMQNPPEEYEMIVTEELYEVALQSRMCGGEPRDYDHHDYEPVQESMKPPPAMIKTMGYDDGYNRRWPSEPKCSPMYQRYMLEYTMGEEQRRSEHVDSTVPYVFETRGMLIAADCRVIRGSFQKG
jgi:hypothetical protein